MKAIVNNIAMICAVLTGVLGLGVYRFSGDVTDMVDTCPSYGGPAFCDCLENTVKEDVGYLQGGLWRTGLFNAVTGDKGLQQISAASVNAAKVCEATG